eukprot:2735895-Amphidinium_carterae.2
MLVRLFLQTLSKDGDGSKSLEPRSSRLPSQSFVSKVSRSKKFEHVCALGRSRALWTLTCMSTRKTQPRKEIVVAARKI